MDPDSKRRYCHYWKNNKKPQCQDIEAQFEEEAKFKLERFMDDIRKFSERSQKRKEKREALVGPLKKPISVQKGLYENAVLGKLSHISVREILGDKYKARRDADILELAGGERETRTSSPAPRPPAQTLSSPHQMSTSLTKELTQPVCSPDCDIVTGKSHCTWSDSTPLRDRRGGAERSQESRTEVDCDERRRRFQEAVAISTEHLVSAIGRVKSSKPRYPDYEKIVKAKILKLCEERFMGELRRNAREMISSPTPTSQVTPPPPHRRHKRKHSLPDQTGAKHEGHHTPVVDNIFMERQSRAVDSLRGNFFDELWGKPSSAMVSTQSGNVWTPPQVTRPRSVTKQRKISGPHRFIPSNIASPPRFPQETSSSLGRMSPPIIHSPMMPEVVRSPVGFSPPPFVASPVSEERNGTLPRPHCALGRSSPPGWPSPNSSLPDILGSPQPSYLPLSLQFRYNSPIGSQITEIKNSPELRRSWKWENGRLRRVVDYEEDDELTASLRTGPFASARPRHSAIYSPHTFS